MSLSDLFHSADALDLSSTHAVTNGETSFFFMPE